VNNENEFENEYQAYLRIAGFHCHPDEITRILGLDPTETWIEGEEYLSPGMRETGHRKFSFWAKESPLLEGDLDEKMEALITVIRPHASRFRELPEVTALVIQGVIQADDFMPGVGFTRDQIKVIADIGATIDVDIFCDALVDVWNVRHGNPVE
jgi:hypothetical protein